MIKIIRATELPIESYTYWSYPVDELEHILTNAEDDGVDETYLYFEGRLYQAPYLDSGETFEEELERTFRSSTNGDYSPSSPWSAPGMSIKDFI